MKLTLEQLSTLVNGQLLGNKDEIVTGIKSLSDAQKGDISFLTNMKYIHDAISTKATVLLIPQNIPTEQFSKTNLIKVKNPQYAYGMVLHIIEKERIGTIKIKVHESASISDSAKVGDNAYIGQNVVIEDKAIIGKNVKIFPNVYIGQNVKIGDDCIFYPNVVIRENTVIGNRVIIQPGAVIGGDGFGFAVIDGKTQKIPQVGNVILGDDVEIGANTTVDKAAIDSTVIANGTKIDNLVMIAHNVKLGQNCMIVSQVGIAGSTHLGNNVTIGGQSGLVGHLKIGNNVTIASQAGVSGNIEDGQMIGGNPHAPLNQSIKTRAVIRKLPQMYQDLRKIKNKLEIND